MSIARVVVDSRLRIELEGIPEEAAAALREACEFPNPELDARRRRGASTWGVAPRVRLWRERVGELVLPRGLTGAIRSVLGAHGVEVRFRDLRYRGAVVERPLRYVGPPLRAHQAAAVAAAVAREQGVIRCATGGGKTLATLALAAELGVNSLVILPNAKLLRQWQGVVERALGISGDEVGHVQESTRRLRPLTVATQQTLASRGVDEEVVRFFGAVIVDEAHHLASSTAQRIMSALPARYRFGFSDDERRKDKREPLTYAVLGGVIHETSRADCEAVGAIVDVEVRILQTEFLFPAWPGEADFNQLLDAMVADAPRNRLVLRVAEAEARAGERVLVLTHRREHARELVGALGVLGVRAGLMLGGKTRGDEEEFARTRDGILDGSVRVGVGTYSAIGEGIDLPAVSVGIAATPIATNRQKFSQVRGRLCRPGKDGARLYVVHDPFALGAKSVANVIAWNRTVRILHEGAWADAREWRRARRSIAQGGGGA